MPSAEILKASDKIKDADDQAVSDNVAKALLREVYVLGAGTVGGAVKEGWKQAADDPLGTGVKLAASVGIGFALGAAQRGTGLIKLGGQALALGLGVSFVTDVISPGRWEQVKSTVVDTWNNPNNTDRNLQAMEKNLGHFAFDTGLMLAGGVGGAKLGQAWHSRSLLRAGSELPMDLKTASAESGLHMSARMHEFSAADATGRRFHADAKGEVGVFERASELLKTQKSYGLHEMGKLQESMLVGKDAVAIELKGKVGEMAKEGAGHKSEISLLQQQQTSLRTELKAAEGMTKENLDVRAAKSAVEGLKAQAEKLPALETELGTIQRTLAEQAKARQDAKKQGGDGESGKKGKDKGEKAEVPTEDLRGRQRELREEIDRIKKDIDETNPESSINRHRVRLAEAELALKAATEAKPARIAEVQGRLDALDSKITEHQTAHQQAGMNLRQAIEAYEARVAELKADNSKLVVKTETAGDAKVTPTAGEKAGSGDKGAAIAQRKVADKGAEVAKGDNGRKGDTAKTEPVKEAEKPAEVAKPREVIATEKAQSAHEAAKEAVAERADKIKLLEQGRAGKAEATRELAEIESGKKTFADEASKKDAVEAAKVKLAKAEADLRQAGKVQYFRPMNQINEYAKAAEEVMIAEPNAAKRDAFIKDAVRNLDDLMSGLPNSRKGAKGEKNLPEPGHTRGVLPEMRLDQMRRHLDARLMEMNKDHAAKVSKVAEIPVVQEAFGKATEGKLSDDATILFFEQGKLVQNKGADGNLYPQFFDVGRYKAGQGRVDRLQGHSPEGYAIVAPKLGRNGQPIVKQIRGENMVIKEVVEVGGTVPEGVGQGTSFGRLLKEFRGAPEVKAATLQSVAPKVEAPTEAKATLEEGLRQDVSLLNEASKVETPAEALQADAAVVPQIRPDILMQQAKPAELNDVVPRQAGEK